MILITKHQFLEKILVALGLIALSAAMYAGVYLLKGDLDYIVAYILLHVSFLPIHALILGIILEGIISFKDMVSRQKKLNLFLGIFFRQMGLEIYLALTEMVQNRDDMEEIIMVGADWNAARFRRARLELERFTPRMSPDPARLEAVLNLLREKEEAIIQLTRNPFLLEFEELYRTLLSLFHLIEETHLRGPLEEMNGGVLTHLSRDAGKSLIHLATLWLNYLEHLKREHPVLFKCKVGVCTMPMLLEETE